MTVLAAPHPPTAQPSSIRSGLRTLKVALIADDFTRSCLAHECRIRDVTPFNAPLLLRLWRPDLLLVESAWLGRRNAWRYRIAAYPDHPERTNAALARVVALARDLGIPAVFWNKEDGVHFDRFIDSARLFDTILTVDETAIPRYRAVLGPAVRLGTLMFGVQPAIHHFTGFAVKHRRANFVGSYSAHVHPRRRAWQDLLFHAAARIGVTAFDRNSDRRSAIYRYPALAHLEVRPSVPHAATAAIYRDYLVSLNVNTVEDSPTMFSRRLVEILACGGIAVTTPSLAVERLFRDYCLIAQDADSARAILDRLAAGPSPEDRERARAGAEHVLRHHTWRQRLEDLLAAIGR